MPITGYTLVELAMVTAIIGIIAAIGLPMMFEAADAWFLASRFQDNAVSSAILVANRMSREMRRLLNDASIITATASQLTFDMNLNGLPYSTNNPVTFGRSGNTLMRTAGLDVDGLADNVTALVYTYLDDNSNTIATPIVVSPNNTNIRIIRADFSISAAGRPLGFRFQVRPQNLRRLNEKFK